jgi:hypothetical protein
MRHRVVRRQIVRVICRHQGDARSFRELDQRLTDTPLGVQAVLLYFQKIVALSHYFLKLYGGRGGVFKTVSRQHGRRDPGHTRRKRDQPLTMLRQQLSINPRLVVKTFRISPGG